MNTPISHITSRAIGTVESVSPDEIRVLIDTDAPRNTALNTGTPLSFPRINSFVLLPNEVGAVVGTVISLGVERSAYPKRQGLKDFGLIDLPFPLRKMTLSPLGTIKYGDTTWILERGVQSYPSVGDTAILPTKEQTIAIVTGQGKDSRIHLGTCPSAHDAAVTVDSDKLFGRHLALLGNTGSGKSCTLAALIRSSFQSAEKVVKEKGNINPNARFILLDPNGEYSTCFEDLGTGCRVYQVPPISKENNMPFHLPAWMWNSSEWSSIAQAAPKTQKPILQTALRDLRSNGGSTRLDIKTRIYGRCRNIYLILKNFEGKGTSNWQENNQVGQNLKTLSKDVTNYITRIEKGGEHRDDTKFVRTLNELTTCVQTILKLNKEENNKISNNKFINFGGFSDTDISIILKKLDKIFLLYPINDHEFSINEDSPIEFSTNELANYLEVIASNQGGNTNQYIASMVMRIKAMLADTRMKEVISPDDDISLVEWLENHIGKNNGAHGAISVIDLSLVPHEILHLVIAVASRLIFEALQRYRKVYNNILPTVLVLEEAHTFVAKKMSYGEEYMSPSDMCRSTFEKIAREGRKFGLGLVLSSQRPSELSETVLSQCNSFLLHRITNDRDQELIHRLVPDTTRGLLKELPSLPTRNCILLGIASKVPTLLEVMELSKKQRPESEDPDFWDVWTLNESREVRWEEIVDNWVGETPAQSGD